MSLKRLGLTLLFTFLLAGCGEKPRQTEGGPLRIVSLSPNITETIFALGLDKQLVGISDFCNYPPQTSQKVRVGGLLNPNMERIIALQPDMLLATPASSKLAGQLKQRGIRTVLLANDRLRDIFITIDSVAALCRVPSKGDSLIRVIKDSLNYYRSQAMHTEVDSPSALFVLQRDPGTTRNISVIGIGTFTDDLWRELGGRNAFEASGLKYAQLNAESLLLMDPDLIIEFKFNQKLDEEQRRQNRREWQTLARLKAVQKGRIYVIDGDYSLIPGPRVTRLMRAYSRILRQYAAAINK